MKGYVQAIFYVVIISLSTIWVSKLGASISISLLLFGVSCIAMVFFNSMCVANFRYNHMTILKTPRLWFGMCMAMFFTWLFSYYSTVHASASYTLTMLFLSAAIVAAIVEHRRITLLLSFSIWGALYFLTPESSLLVLLASTGSGVSLYLYFKLSVIYAKRHDMSAMNLLSIRFYPMVLFSIAYMMFDLETARPLYENLTLTHLLYILLALGILNMVVPNLLSQSSAQNIGAERFSFITTLVPTTCYLLQGVLIGTWSLSIFIACLLSSVILNSDSIANVVRVARSRNAL